MMRSRLIFLIISFLLLLGMLGIALLLSGIAPIAASDGHWAVTRAVLQLGKERAVETHSIGIDAPELQRPDLVFKGAGHYESGCRPCHGRPGEGPPPVARAMLPAPPDLARRVPRWDPEELFYIVRHGIKFTGMPAWPSSQREDEVWAVAAFLLSAPELDAAEYQQLVFGAEEDSVGGAEVEVQALDPAQSATAQSCARCHGADGDGRMPSTVPKLAGQRPLYLATALDAFAERTRHSGMMAPIAASLSPLERRQLAAHFAALVRATPSAMSASAEGDRHRGAAIANAGLAGRGVPPCRDCHGPTEEPRNPMYPLLTGQYPEYLALQLLLFKERRRGGSAYAHLMQHIAARLNREDMRDVAAYYGTVAVVPEPGPP